MDCEVFSWKIEVEEPTAAAVISTALNKCSDFAIRIGVAWWFRARVPMLCDAQTAVAGTSLIS